MYKMKDEDMINEMAEHLKYTPVALSCIERFDIAQSLHRDKYRKIETDDVLLSKEEYENLYTQEQYDKIYEQVEANFIANNTDGGASCHLCMDYHEKKARKEMVDKICEWLEEIGEHGRLYATEIRKIFDIEK